MCVCGVSEVLAVVFVAAAAASTAAATGAAADVVLIGPQKRPWLSWFVVYTDSESQTARPFVRTYAMPEYVRLDVNACVCETVRMTVVAIVALTDSC